MQKADRCIVYISRLLFLQLFCPFPDNCSLWYFNRTRKCTCHHRMIGNGDSFACFIKQVSIQGNRNRLPFRCKQFHGIFCKEPISLGHIQHTIPPVICNRNDIKAAVIAVIRIPLSSLWLSEEEARAISTVTDFVHFFPTAT